MKIPKTLRIHKAFSKDRKGVALITVLTVMALTTILVLTFFSLATSEHRASSTYSHGLHAHQVAEEAVNLVIAQIREGTDTEDPGTGLGQRKAWACQPGAIRRWENDGRVDAIYKLYSDDSMLTSDPNELGNDFRDLKGWSKLPAHYVDLNEPVIRGKKVYYPVVHPAASIMPDWPGELDGDRNGIEGFAYDSTAVEEGTLGRKAAAVAKADDGHLAMPVMWLYQLADGTVGYLDQAGSDTSGYKFVPISGKGKPTEKNQMVARFAFWADDETQKLNLNTHAGGLAWDIPKAGGELDMAMGRYQPAQKEWQRYPGHPASTHLGPALSPGILDIVNDRDAMEMLYEVVPRVVGGGSESGTRLIDTRSKEEENGLIPDTEPLFPSIDDMIMRSDREPHEYPDASGRPIPDDELSEYLERSKFFITAYSRAPEVNLFNLPKVAMWPLYNVDRAAGRNSPYQERLTAFDRLIHYCASVGGPSSTERYDYIFRREQADSATYDYEFIERNRTLYNYLDQMMSENVPGFGDSFSSKYGASSQKQLLTQIFDYIRSTNLHDDTIYAEDFEAAFSKQNNSTHLTYTNPRDGNQGNLGFGHKGHGQVTPIAIDDTHGMGRFHTLSSASVAVSVVADPWAQFPSFPGVRQYGGGYRVSPSEDRVSTNYPPLPDSVKEDDSSTWPQWIKDLGGEEAKLAVKKENWNWQLMFLNPQYRAGVMSNPTERKFRLPPGYTKEDAEGLRLQPSERLVQAIFMFDLFSPHIGWVGINPDLQIDITALNGMTFQGGAIPFLGFTNQGDRPSSANYSDSTFRWTTNWAKPHREGGARAWGGLLPFSWIITARDVLGEHYAKPRHSNSVWWQLWRGENERGTPKAYTTSPSITSRLTPLDRGYDRIVDAVGRVSGKRQIGGDAEDVAQAYRYDLVTIPFKVGPSDLTFDGGAVMFEIYDGGPYSENSKSDDGEASLSQTISLEFPGFSFPVKSNLDLKMHASAGHPGYVNEFDALSSDSGGVLENASVTADPANPYDSPVFSASMRAGPWSNSIPRTLLPTAFHDPPQSQGFRGLNVRGRMADAIHWNGPFIRGGDVVQSVSVGHGDVRLVASKKTIELGEMFVPHRRYGSRNELTYMAHSLTNAIGVARPGFNVNAPGEKDYLIIPTLPGNNSYNRRIPFPFPTYKSADVQQYGDFDNGAGTMIDGPYINKPDEGNVHALKTKYQQEVVHYWERLRNYGEYPYFSNPEKAESGGPSYFSPNRIVSGPGMFGSLPTGLGDDKPWQTLLFRPDVSGDGYKSHPGAASPPDHLVMDLFWMPVVEPYAISEPLSTAGKINLNCEIVPFLHIDRTTALRGVFRSEYMVCIPNEYHDDYKHGRGRGRGYHWRDNPYGGELQGKRLRSVILETPTLDQFKDRFDEGRDIFKSATEICEIHLIPQQVSERLGSGRRGSIGTYTPDVREMENGKYWRDHALVGDNSRERPYANIHQRLTTKSNTFKVHYRAQVIKQSRRERDSDYEVWKPEMDSVQAEYRGSSIIERFVDPNDTDLPDFAQDPTESLTEYYQFRIVNPRRFAP